MNINEMLESPKGEYLVGQILSGLNIRDTKWVHVVFLSFLFTFRDRYTAFSLLLFMCLYSISLCVSLFAGLSD